MEGTRLGPYQVLDELGSGGMGTVYRAEAAGSVRGLDPGCTVALKVLHAHLLSRPGFFKRFLREARIGQEVRHENVVRTYDCDAALGTDGRQQNFLVMEYVEGRTLRGLLEELDRVPEELCRHIGREVAKGLAAIHQAGVVHRDLKPENVLITPEHVVKVMDLGVARLQDEAIRLSQAGSFVGSLEYAAPEQFRSSASEPDGRADLYALGVVLYELATGQHPFRDEEASRVIHRILDETPRKAGELNPQLSPFFEELVQTLIAKDPTERFADALTLVRVLGEGEAGAWWKERARALRLEARRPLRRVRIPRETALYGRDGDLAELQALFEDAKAGDGRVLLIEGEAGIGKTRLVDELVGRLRQRGEDLNFLFGSYPPGGAATVSGAFSEAYRQQFGAEALHDTLEEYLTVTPLLVPAFAALLTGDVPPSDAEALTKESLQTVFVHATWGLAAERPTIVLIDDLHFAPEDGRALFASLALAVPGHRVLLLGTMRPGVPGDWIANVERLDHAGRTILSRLGLKDFSALLKDAFRSERLAHELGMKIAEKSDGNPFFAFEIIRGLREGQLISKRPDGTWATTRVIEDIQVPSSVTDLVQARIASLTDEEKNLLDVASCCGFEFDPLLVAGVLGTPEISTLQRLAKIERQHRLVRSSARRFVFDHHQVQEALYGGLPDLLRERYHAAIAEAMEIRSDAADRDPKGLEGPLCVDLCEHYLKGARGEKALRYLDAALSHLEAGYLNDQTIELADRALASPGLLVGARRIEILLEKHERLDLLGRRAAEERVLEEAYELAEAQDDGALRGRVEGARGVLLWKIGRYEEAIARLEHCLALARESGDRRGVAGATGNLGAVLYALGRLEEAKVHQERCLILFCESGDRLGEAMATGSLGLVFGAMGRQEEAKVHHERSLALFREIGARWGEADATGNLGTVFSALGRLEEAKAHYESQLAVSREIGARQGEAISLVNLGGLWSALGERGRAREAVDASLGICPTIGLRYPEGYGLLCLALLADEEGSAEEALRLAEESLALRRGIGHGEGVVDSLLALGKLRWGAGEAQAARAALEEALGLAREQGGAARVARARALLSCLPHEDAAAAETALGEAGDSANTPEIRYHLWVATRKPEHLAEAKRLLDYRTAHAPAEYRSSMRKNVRLNREITEAWEALESEA